MEKRLAAEVALIDVCPACGGTWLDKSELKVIEKKAEEDDWSKGFFRSGLVG